MGVPLATRFLKRVQLWRRTACSLLVPRLNSCLACLFGSLLCLVAGWAALQHLPRTREVASSDGWKLPLDQAGILALLSATYDGINGMPLSAEDTRLAEQNGTFRKTYGEFTIEGVNVLLEVLNVSATDTFCDLGSGVGKVVVQALLQKQPAAAVGIELSEMRHRKAVEASHRLQHLAPTALTALRRPADGSVAVELPPSQLRLLHGDMLDLDSEVARCTKIFFCSTAWPKELLERMEQKLLSLPFVHRPVLVASSRELKGLGELLHPQRVEGARFVRHARVDTSWGASFITLYRLGQ